MKPDVFEFLLAHLIELFPGAEWPLPVQELLAKRLSALPIAVEPAKNALTELRMRHKFPRAVQPCEVLDALDAAVRAAGRGRGTGGQDHQTLVESLLRSNPDRFWHLALGACLRLNPPLHYIAAPHAFAMYPPTRDFIAEHHIADDLTLVAPEADALWQRAKARAGGGGVHYEGLYQVLREHHAEVGVRRASVERPVPARPRRSAR